MHILLVQRYSNYGGSTISGWLTAQGFRDAGWKVDVAFGFEGPAARDYSDLGCGIHVIPHDNWLRGGGLLRSAHRIVKEWQGAAPFRRLIDQLHPDIVYVNSLVSLAAAVSAKQRRIPCIWHLRELFEDVGGEMLLPRFGGRRLVRELLMRFAVRRIAISQAVAKNIFGTAAPPIVDIVANAVSAPFFDLQESKEQCRALLNLPVDVPIVGVPGTLRPVKGHFHLFNVADLVRKKKPDCVFAIAGSGSAAYTQELRQRVRELALEPSIIFLGTVSAMMQFYRASDVICVPSISESFGRTAIEAFAVGTPVVASRVGGLCETIQDGVTGFLVPFGDVDAAADRILYLLAHPQAAHRMSSRAREDALHKYTASHYQSRTRHIVEAVHHYSTT